MSFGLQKRSEKFSSPADDAPTTPSLVTNYDTELHLKCRRASDLVFKVIAQWQEHYRVKPSVTPAAWRLWSALLVVADKDGFRAHSLPVDDLHDVFEAARDLSFSVFDIQDLMVPYSKQTESIIQTITRRAT